MSGAGSRRVVVASLDNWAPAVRAAILAEAPAELDVRIATSGDRAEQLKLAAEADLLLAGRAPIDAEIIAAAKNLRFIQKWGIGVDSVDLDALRKRGIPLAIAAGSNANPVAEHAILLMLAALRRLPLVDAATRRGAWMSQEMRSICRSLTGRTVGLVGFGNIGRLVALKLRGFDTTTLYYDVKPADRVTERAFNVSHRPLDTLLAESDIVSLHLLMTAATKHMMNAATLAKMRPHAVLINTARGGLVDEAALAHALRTGVIGAAGLDVFEAEPTPGDNPLLALDNIVVTPHTSASVIDNVPNVARQVFGNMMRFLRGEDLPPADVILPVRI